MKKILQSKFFIAAALFVFLMIILMWFNCISFTFYSINNQSSPGVKYRFGSTFNTACFLNPNGSWQLDSR